MTPTERVSALETLLERIRRNAAEPRGPRAALSPSVGSSEASSRSLAAGWVARSEPDLLPGSIALPGEREEVEPPTFDPSRALGRDAAADAEAARPEDSQREPEEPATLVRENNAQRPEAASAVALEDERDDHDDDDGAGTLEVDFDDVEIVEDPTLDVASATRQMRDLRPSDADAAAATALAEQQRIEAERLEQERLQVERLAAERDEAERIAREETMRQVAEAARARAEQEEAAQRALDEQRELEEAERFEAELAAREQRRAAERAQERAQERARSFPPRPEPEIDRIEAERIRREQAERSAAETSARAREEARRQAIDEAERQAVERAEADRLARAAAAAARREEEERREAERIAREEGERLVAEQAARQAEEERLERERLDTERLEEERVEQERLEAERLEAERLEQERLEQVLAEQERHEAERLEQERLQAERLREEVRLEAERAETERLDADLDAQSLAVTAERASAQTLIEATAQAAGEPESGVVEATPISSRQPKQDDYRSIDDGFGELLDAEEPPPESGEVQSQRKPTIHEEPTLVAALDEWSAQASATGDPAQPALEDPPPFAEVSRVSTRPPGEARRADSAPPLRSLPQELQGDVIRRPPSGGEAATFVGAMRGRDAASFGDLLDASLSLAPR